MSADSTTDAWAVGSYEDEASGALKTLILHWDGTIWSQVTSPVFTAALYAVSTDSATDAWAVGSYKDRTLILHWDGTNWSRVKSPHPGPGSSVLVGVIAESATEAWAVGSFGPPDAVSRILILHWDGTTWSRVQAPNPNSTDTSLNAVGADSAKHAWAVGEYVDDSTGARYPLILHWNGTRWSRTSIPTANLAGPTLFGVSAVGPRNAWAVGVSYTGGVHPLILHWNGKRWRRVKSPDPGSKGNALAGVSADSAKDAWAIGSHHSKGTDDVLVLHWDGTRWSQVDTPNLGSDYVALHGVSAHSRTDSWVVGTYTTAEPYAYETLALHWDGTSWSQE